MDAGKTAKEICMSHMGAYCDYPFDENWLAVRHSENKKVFAFIYEHKGGVWMNLKVDPLAVDVYMDNYPDVRPAYHMNKEHWISVILGGTMKRADLEMLISESYRLTAPRRRAL